MTYKMSVTVLKNNNENKRGGAHRGESLKFVLPSVVPEQCKHMEEVVAPRPGVKSEDRVGEMRVDRR